MLRLLKFVTENETYKKKKQILLENKDTIQSL